MQKLFYAFLCSALLTVTTSYTKNFDPNYTTDDTPHENPGYTTGNDERRGYERRGYEAQRGYEAPPGYESSRGNRSPRSRRARRSSMIANPAPENTLQTRSQNAGYEYPRYQGSMEDLD